LENKDLAVEVKGLTKKFGQLTAVDHINFDVKNGEFFGFLGPNGAGKTTTARILTGVIKKSAGEATVKGYPAGSFAAKQLSGVMPEISNAYLDLTAWGNILLIAELYRVPPEKAKARAAALLEQLGLFERKDSKASTFSMGMRKRLVLCMALIPDPEILFLDEPTSGLDVQSVRFTRALLKNVKQEGKTIFFTTHNMDEAAEMCDRVAIISHGKIVALDTPGNLSINAGRVFLIDVSFDKPVSQAVLSKLPGVNRLETAQAIEESDRMRAQQAMAGVGRPGGMGGGTGPSPAMMRKMQQMNQGGGSQPSATAKKPSESAGAPIDMAGLQKLVQADGGPTPEMRNLMMKMMQGGGPTPAGTTEILKLIEERKRAQGKTPGNGGANKPDVNRFRLYTENTTLLVTTLVDFSREKSLKMNILNVRPPSLEDAFVRLTEEKSREK
jgi:ABC-2 type transport system ATP-binding protein